MIRALFYVPLSPHCTAHIKRVYIAIETSEYGIQLRTMK